MPLFRKRSSSRSQTEATSATGSGPEGDNVKPTLLARLSRWNSGARDPKEPAPAAAVETNPHQVPHHVTPAIPLRPSSRGSQKGHPPGVFTASPVPASLIEHETVGDSLSKDDVKRLFFAAPHFMLEKGKHRKSFPQAFFPWNSDLEVSDLQDRRWMKHESFALSTLHAHLPIPDEMSWKPSSLGPQKHGELSKRPTFDLGIFEVPNMLGLEGKEPGTVGFRYFLELPLADRLRTSEHAEAEAKTAPIVSNHEHLSKSEAISTLWHGSGTVNIGKHAAHQDRLRLIREGARSWKGIGVRDVKPAYIAERLSVLGLCHDEIISEGWQTSILDKQDRGALYATLFENVLFPPEKGTDEANPQGLKVQVEALIKVLTTPGAWVDFSILKWRVRIGQILWQLPPHQDNEHDDSDMTDGNERHWLLLQLLLAIELLIRLDGAMRLGIVKNTDGFELTANEIHHFNKLRNTKVDWDLVVARRFLDMLDVRRAQVPFLSPYSSRPRRRPANSLQEPMQKHERGPEPEAENPSAWECAIVPRHSRVQLEGLLRFAHAIRWPAVDLLEDTLKSRILSTRLSLEELYATPIPSTVGWREDPVEQETKLTSGPTGADWNQHACVVLQPATGSNLGGWLSRSWLTGLVLPSEAATAILMSCLLENDPGATEKLGNIAYLRGGFVLNARSWWSKSCIVGRVLAVSREATECMGWINTPRVLPVNSESKVMHDCWIDVSTKAVPNLRQRARIQDGVKLAEESSPLGSGHGKVLSSEFVMITDEILEETSQATVSMGMVRIEPCIHSKTKPVEYKASVQFELDAEPIEKRLSRSLELSHDVYFVSAHPCRLPHGHAVFNSKMSHHHAQHKYSEHLPAHPLHKTYMYTPVGVFDLEETGPPDPAKQDSAVWIVDARSDGVKEMYTRAWCSQVGNHAVIARVGKVCLSCAIREAKALQIGVIVRVGSEDSPSGA